MKTNVYNITDKLSIKNKREKAVNEKNAGNKFVSTVNKVEILQKYFAVPIDIKVRNTV